MGPPGLGVNLLNLMSHVYRKSRLGHICQGYLSKDKALLSSLVSFAS